MVVEMMSSDELVYSQKAAESREADSRYEGMGTAQQTSLKTLEEIGAAGNPCAARETDSDPHFLQSLRNNITMYVEAIREHPELAPELARLQEQYVEVLRFIRGEQ